MLSRITLVQTPGFFYILKLDPSYLYEPADGRDWIPTKSLEHGEKLEGSVMQWSMMSKWACELECASSGRTGYYPVDMAIVPDQRRIKERFNK